MLMRIALALFLALAAGGAALHAEDQQKAWQKGCRANQVVIENGMAVWFVQNQSLPDGQSATVEFDTHGAVRSETGFAQLKDADQKPLGPGSQFLAKVISDPRVFRCPARVAAAGGDKALDKLREAHYAFFAGLTPHGFVQKARCLVHGAPKMGPDGTAESQHSPKAW